MSATVIAKDGTVHLESCPAVNRLPGCTCPPPLKIAPAPFEIIDDDGQVWIADANGIGVARIIAGRLDGTGMDNARLLAAAPALLHALREYVHPFQSGTLTEDERRDKALAALALAGVKS